MAEIRLGSNVSMSNINLGAIEIQEVYLGDVLVWQNNQGPLLASLGFSGPLGSTFTATEGLIDADETLYFGTYNGSATTVNVSFNTVTDPDNEEENVDRIVGYRIQRPDGTWNAGDTESTGNRADGAPISEFGQPIPSQSYTWTAADGFTAGPFSLSSFSVPITLRDTDASDTTVTAATQEFRDEGVWKFFVVDSRGGTTPMMDVDITGQYQTPAPTITGATTVDTNASFTLSSTNAGGPITAYAWSGSGTGTNSTLVQTAPASATTLNYSLTTTGRVSANNVAGTGSDTHSVIVRVPCSISYTVNSSSYSLNNGCSSFGYSPTGSATISCSGSGCFSTITGNVNSGSFSQPNPTCPSGGTPQTATVTVSGSVTNGTDNVSGSGSRSYTAGTPSASYTCVANYGLGTSSTTVTSSSPTCTDTTPASQVVSAAAASCFLGTIPLGSNVCSDGRTCGSHGGCSCGSVNRNSSGSCSATGCLSASSPGPAYTLSGLTATVSSENVGFFNVTIAGTATRNNSPDTGAIGSVRGTSTDCAFNSSYFDSLGNGNASNPQTFSDFLTITASGNGGAGATVTCTFEIYYQIGGYSGTAGNTTITATGTFA